MENGTYRGKALGAVLGETSKGNEQVAIEFGFFDVENARLTYFGTFGEKALEHTLKALRAAGWKGDDLSDLSSIGGPDAPEVDLVVENEEYEGKVRPRIRWVNPRGGPSVKAQLTPDKAKAFAARMRGAVLAHDRTHGQQRAAAPARSNRAPEPPPLTDSDMPPF